MGDEEKTSCEWDQNNLKYRIRYDRIDDNVYLKGCL